MKEWFKDWNPSKQSEHLINCINKVLEDYRRQGYILTLRQLYYQLVSRDIIPNSLKEYHKIGNVVSSGRLAGLIDWNMIEDRTRTPSSRSHWDSPNEILATVVNAYYRSRWETQKTYVEVWCEKDAVSNIIEPVCKEWDVVYMANRGYSSQSAMYSGAQRLIKARERGAFIIIIYIGDHDPSGIDMTRDIDDRLGLFVFGGDAKLDTVDRIALNMDQIEEYEPPRNPAKMTDSRYESYREIHGDSSWELDALEPAMLRNVVEEKIKQHIDFDEWEQIEKIENEHKEKLRKIANNFENISFPDNDQ